MYLSEESMDVDDSDDEEWIDRDGNAFDAFEIDEEEEFVIYISLFTNIYLYISEQTTLKIF